MDASIRLHISNPSQTAQWREAWALECFFVHVKHILTNYIIGTTFTNFVICTLYKCGVLGKFDFTII